MSWCNHISASSIASYKACATHYRLAYVEGLRPSQDTDSQRQGSSWHAMFEVYGKTPGDHDTKLAAVVSHLNERYDVCPTYKTANEWAIERQILLMSFLGHCWYYQNDVLEYLANEIKFEHPLIAPKVGLPLPLSEVKLVGRIDNIVKWRGGVCALERKSTSRSIAADSDFWQKWAKDSQISMYALAFRTLRDTIDLNVTPDSRYGNTLVDVWHKPTIKPAMLTQAETKGFIESKEYCGQMFRLPALADGPDSLTVNDEIVTVEPGKKGFAIRESVEMFGARLLQDIYARPEFYFVRREIARTDAEIRGFQEQLFAVYQSQKAADKSGCWIENESACRATYACQYIPICYGAGANAVCDGKTTPANFKRIFTPLTVGGVECDE